MNAEPRVLVVDDQPINIKLLQRKLEREGMQVETALNGRECIERVRKEPPDLILLDVMMPEMDGIETCQELKKDPQSQTIPIIFITAKSSKEGKLEGLDAGAVDYITKPIDLEETLARVRTQLKIQSIYRENMELQTRLGESRRTAAVGAITQGIAHNLNNLLGVVVGYLDLLKSGVDNPDMVKRSVTLMDQSIGRMVNIVRQLSSIATSERVQLHEVPVASLIEGSLERFREEFHISIDVPVKSELPGDFTINANAEVFESIVGRLLINAWEAYPDSEEADRRISMEAEVGETQGTRKLLVRVIDEGSGISNEVVDTLFEPFITTKTSVGRGLGLTMARHTLRNLGGDLVVQNRKDGKGAVAEIQHPL